jgi:peptidoglycan-N-acetylglucosamine deacetylase
MNLLTVDLEDWFHICEVDHLLPREKWDSLPSTVVGDTEKLLHCLEDSGSKATFFVLGYVAARHPHLIEQLHRMGHEIAFHGWDHELVYTLSPEAFRCILRRGVKTIQVLTGKRPLGFRAPQWSINQRAFWALEVLTEEGFLYDSSMVPLKFIGNEAFPTTPYAVATPAGSLQEFPPLTLWTPWGRYPAGGGWGLRCLPGPIFQHEVHRLNARNTPALFYFHPREFGARQLVRGLPPLKKFVLEARIWSSKTQLLRLLSEFRFVSIADFLALPCPPLPQWVSDDP